MIANPSGQPLCTQTIDSAVMFPCSLPYMRKAVRVRLRYGDKPKNLHSLCRSVPGLYLARVLSWLLKTACHKFRSFAKVWL